jgi:iron(III) transport system substrate-binding protein
VKVQLWRGQSDEVVQRVTTEAKGRRFAVDVIETNGPEMEMIAREKAAWRASVRACGRPPRHAIPRTDVVS